MTRRAVLLVLMVLSLTPFVNGQKKADGANPAIDMKGYLRIAAEAARHRESRRLSEDQFIAMSREPGTIILDARSKEKFDELHIKGAMNLSFPDIAVESLNRMLPDKNARILIYCNNNFSGPAAVGPFPTKIATASLNISTYIALYNYGYRNVYELGPLLDLKSTKLEFEPLVPAAPVEASQPTVPTPVVVSP
jgi:phage shock protein E